MDKRLTKIIGLKMSEFNELVTNKQIQVREARLIPFSKPGDEISLASVLMCSLKLIKEFRKNILKEVKMSSGGNLHVFTEVCFENSKDRPDGLLLLEKSGVIVDAALIELKNNVKEIELDQIERYSVIAKNLNIPRIITVSNQFVSDPTQSPLNLKSTKTLSYFHLSWSYILTIGHILLSSEDNKIEDEDQANVMKEVLNYFENDNSGICDFNQMKPGWTELVNHINGGQTIKAEDMSTKDTIQSWQQQEMDIALKLSKSLGLIVSSGDAKHKSDLGKRFEDDSRELITQKTLGSTFKIKGAVSKLNMIAFFEKRVIEMSVMVKAPQDKKIKGQMGWIEKQLLDCKKKDEKVFECLKADIRIDIYFKNTSKPERLTLEKFWSQFESFKDKEIREFGVILFKDFGKDFSSRKNFVSTIGKMAIDFYSVLVEHLRNGEVIAPKMKEDEPAITVEVPSEVITTETHREQQQIEKAGTETEAA